MESIDPVEISNYTSDVADFYGVDLESVQAQISYTSSGTMSISIPNNITKEELINSIANTISESLSIHPSEVDVTIDMNAGEVEFSITSENYAEAIENKHALRNPQRISSIIETIESINGAIVENYEVSNDITSSVEFTVDASDTSNDLTQAAWQSKQLLSDFDVVVESSYVTPAPTFDPSISPTTSLPSAAPSLTGAVAIIELSRMVTESLTSDEIGNIQNEVAESYGVDSDDIVVDVIYEITGLIAIDVVDDVLTDEELETAIRHEIAAMLGIHEGNIDVIIEDGNAQYTIRVAQYTVESESAETAQDIQDVIREQSSLDDLSNAIAENVPALSVLAVVVDDDIGSEIVVTVDTTGAENNLENAARELEDTFVQQGFAAQADSNSLCENGHIWFRIVKLNEIFLKN